MYPRRNYGPMGNNAGLNSMAMMQQRRNMGLAMTPSNATGMQPFATDEHGNPTAVMPGAAAAPPANETEEERQMRLMHERNAVTVQSFAVLGQILQLGAAIARGGSEMLSIIVGTTFAFRTAKYLLQGNKGVPPFPLQAAAAVPSSPTQQSAVSTPVGPSPPAQTAPPSLLANLFKSPGTMLLIIGAVVVAEHLFKVWRNMRERQRLEEEERWLATQAQWNALTAPPTTDANSAAAASGARGGEAISRDASDVFVARHPYTAAAENQLNLQPGDQLTIEAFDPNGWCWAVLTNVARRGPDASRVGPIEGFIPGNYVEPVIPRIRRL